MTEGRFPTKPLLDLLERDNLHRSNLCMDPAEKVSPQLLPMWKWLSGRKEGRNRCRLLFRLARNARGNRRLACYQVE
jgi:hypothetical protein